MLSFNRKDEQKKLKNQRQTTYNSFQACCRLDLVLKMQGGYVTVGDKVSYTMNCLNGRSPL